MMSLRMSLCILGDAFDKFNDEVREVLNKTKITYIMLHKIEIRVGLLKWNSPPRTALSDEAKDVMSCLKYSGNSMSLAIWSMINTHKFLLAFRRKTKKSVCPQYDPANFNGSYDDWRQLSTSGKLFKMINSPLENILSLTRNLITSMIQIWRSVKRLSESMEEIGCLRKISNIMERLAEAFLDLAREFDRMTECLTPLNRRLLTMLRNGYLNSTRKWDKDTEFNSYIARKITKLNEDVNSGIQGLGRSCKRVSSFPDLLNHLYAASLPANNYLEEYIRKCKSVTI